MLKIECETSITFNLEEDHALLWTCQPKMLRRMAKLGIQPYRNDGEGKAFKIPKEWVSVRKPKVMILSESRKQGLRDRMKSIRR